MHIVNKKCIQQTRVTVLWRAFVDTVMNSWILKCRIFFNKLNIYEMSEVATYHAVGVSYVWHLFASHGDQPCLQSITGECTVQNRYTYYLVHEAVTERSRGGT
jgi:hypothetical protein